MPQKIATPVNPKVNDKWYNIRRFMGEKTQENLTMGYSAAYPTGRERIHETRYGYPLYVSESRCDALEGVLARIVK